MDEGSATVAKEALHNYKLDGENKIKVRLLARICSLTDMIPQLDHVRKEVNLVPAFEAGTVLCISPFSLERFSLPLLNATYVEVPRDP
jgi:hypothetical protein